MLKESKTSHYFGSCVVACWQYLDLRWYHCAARISCKNVAKALKRTVCPLQMWSRGDRPFFVQGFSCGSVGPSAIVDQQWFGSGRFLRAASSSRILVEVFVSSKHFFRQLRILALLILGANGKGGYSGGYSGGALVAMQVTKSYQLCLQVRSHSIIGTPRTADWNLIKYLPHLVLWFLSLLDCSLNESKFLHPYGFLFISEGATMEVEVLSTYQRSAELFFWLVAGFVQRELHMFIDKMAWTFCHKNS